MTQQNMFTEQPQTANCARCKRLLQVSTTRREDSRPFKRSLTTDGFCPECVVTQFLYNTYPINMQIDEAGPALLLKPGIPQVFAQFLEGTNCELKVEEVDWKYLVANWKLPIDTPRDPQNPYRMGESPKSTHEAYEPQKRRDKRWR